jgi:NAD-dependent oxidoreductase involved in siderophore biosynthesis
VFRTIWPAGVRGALARLRTAIETGEDPLRRGQYYLTLCQLWQDVTLRLGPPDLVQATRPAAPVTSADLDAVAAAGVGA